MSVRRHAGLIGVALWAASGCAGDTTLHPAYDPGQIVTSDAGMVVSDAEPATRAGVEMLEAGGNAVDAAVATAFALAVVEPSRSGIGGRTQMLIRTADGTYVGIDGSTMVPASSPPTDGLPEDGWTAAAVPGTVAALALAAERFGSKPLAELMAPAIRLAEEGVVLSVSEADAIAGAAEALRAHETGGRYFLKPDGSPYVAGERLVQADLARMLRAVAESGPEVFYRGWIADTIAAAMARHGGFVTADDMAGYAAVENLVIHGEYRGWELVGTYLSTGGVVTLETMHILAGLDLAGRAGTPEWAALIGQALLLAREDFMDARAVPDDADAARFLSDEWARRRAAELEDPATVPIAASGSPPDEVVFAEAGHTTHVSVADGSGMLVALTQSVGPTMGSRVAAPGLGFLYAATMGYLTTGIRPYARAVTYQSPIIVLRDGQPRFVLGAAGGHRIVSAVTEVLSRLVDQGLDLPHAMAAARLNPLADTVYMEVGDEARWTDDEITDLRGFGLPAGPRESSYFARVNGIAIDPATGTFTGVADPRWAGTAGGVGAVRR